MSALIEDNETDYTLSHEYPSCWITVDNLSVYILRTDEGVSVDIFPVGCEADESLAGCWALNQEADDDE
jgi:hypothetical protein